MMPDAYLDALRDYEREIAPAYEVVRRARHRLAKRLRSLLDHPPADDLRLHALWATRADPEEPNGPELAMPIEQPVQGPAMERQGTGERGTSPAAPTDAEAVRDGRTPADQAGERGFDTRPPLQAQPGSQGPVNGEAGAAAHTGPAPASRDAKPRKETHLCPRCDRPFDTAHAVRVHVGRAHPDVPAPLPVGGHRRKPADAVLHPGAGGGAR